MSKIEDKIYIWLFIFGINQNEVFLKSRQKFAVKLLVLRTLIKRTIVFTIADIKPYFRTRF